MSVDNPPSLEEFLAAPPKVVARVAPKTAVYAPGGTRRAATLAGVAIDDGYIEWVRPQLIESVAVFFRLGVQHVIVPSIGPRNLLEGGTYGQRVVQWIADLLAGSAMVAEYQKRGWQARMLAPASLPSLCETAARLQQETQHSGAPTVWWYLVADNADPWSEVLALAQQSGAPTQAAAILALYGTDIPPADLYVGFGKPALGTTMVPPLLTGESLHGYWTQRPGFDLSEQLLRAILYDYAYSRRTWEADHSARYAQAHRYATLWQTENVLGVGTKRDGYWYPRFFPLPALPDDALAGA